jgi:lysozyme
MGIDVYNGTGPIDWAKVRAAGHAFAFVKATEGLTLIDHRLQTNLAGMAAAGMVRGAYHFFHVAPGTGAQQAAHFVNATRDAGYDFTKDLPLALDLEDRAGTGRYGAVKMRAEVQAFNAELERLTGKRPIIYLDYDFGQNLLGDGYGGHPLWIASYTGAEQPHVPKGWERWTFWQYGEYGRVDGVYGSVVDMDRWNGSEAELRAWAAA